MYNSAAQAYRQVSLSSASPERLLDEVLHRVELACDAATQAIGRKDVPARGKAVGRAIELLTALATALDHSQAPELCSNLARLYEFAMDRLVTANLHADPKAVAEARAVVVEIRSGFAQAIQHGG